jgi:hypothetical protein
VRSTIAAWTRVHDALCTQVNHVLGQKCHLCTLLLTSKQAADLTNTTQAIPESDSLSGHRSPHLRCAATSASQIRVIRVIPIEARVLSEPLANFGRTLPTRAPRLRPRCLPPSPGAVWLSTALPAGITRKHESVDTIRDRMGRTRDTIRPLWPAPGAGHRSRIFVECCPELHAIAQDRRPSGQSTPLHGSKLAATRSRRVKSSFVAA